MYLLALTLVKYRKMFFAETNLMKISFFKSPCHHLPVQIQQENFAICSSVSTTDFEQINSDWHPKKAFSIGSYI